MTETSPMNADFSREKADCGICYTGLTRKRTVRLTCSHVFHRTCLLNVCESNGVTLCKFRCPLCQDLFAFDEVLDENGAKLPEIYGFGPTGQPSEIEIVEVLERPDQAHILDHMVTLTVTFLQHVSIHLEEARKEGDKSEEYIKDMVDERSKLIRRLRILDEILGNLSDIKKRIRNAEGREVSITDAFEKVLTEIVEDQSDNSDEPTCGICFEALSRKRSVSLTPCAHKFHWTCFAKWMNTKESCCFCRTTVTKVTGENGEDVKEPFPMDSRKDDLLQRRILLSYAKLEDDRRIVTRMMQQRHQQRRLALRDGKSAEWIADIDQEMESLRKRSKALDEYHLAVTEIKAIEAAKARGTEQEAAEAAVANPAAATDDDLGDDNAPVLESTGRVVGYITMRPIIDVSSDYYDHRIPIGYIGEGPDRITVYSDNDESDDDAVDDAARFVSDVTSTSDEVIRRGSGEESATEESRQADADPPVAHEASVNGDEEDEEDIQQSSENSMNRRRRADTDADAAAAVQQKRRRS